MLDVMNAANQGLNDLYKSSKKLCTIIVSVQGKSHGLVLRRKATNDDYPNGLAWELIEKAKNSNNPSDASAIIKLEIELD